MNYLNYPNKQGLYNPQFEHDSCGVGFVCNIKGLKSYDVLKKGINVLRRLSHRGAVGSDPKTGDGAGILIQIPDAFLRNECQKTGILLPDEGRYGTGLIFLPPRREERDYCLRIFEEITMREGQKLLGWRNVPVDDSIIGETARVTKPFIGQVFIEQQEKLDDQLYFERKLYVIRKQIENNIRISKIEQKSFFYITNLSSLTLSYKGLLMPNQLDEFFPDLKDEKIKTALCLVHSRYSTNTFPTWDLSQPFRFLAHNGEINTLRGNINWMHAREGLLASDLFGDDIQKIKPVIVPDGSDSAALDNVFELLVLSGRTLSHAMAMLIPAAWGKYSLMDDKLKDFYKYHACFMEPWDGPAAIAFTDGSNIGAVLDRNGLRPARYIVTKDDFVVMASEVGVLDTEPCDIKLSGRLKPGKMFFVDTKLGAIVDDDEIKKTLYTSQPYSKWIKDNMVELNNLTYSSEAGFGYLSQQSETDISIITSLKAFGYTREDLKFIIKPMAENGIEPTGSMGNDTPYAVLSKKQRLLYDYFKQLFAQVTNPAIDSIREDFVMSIRSFIGPQKNILTDTPLHCCKLDICEPILNDNELEKIRCIKEGGFKTKTISILFKPDDKQSFLETLNNICQQAESAIKEKYSFIILSDRGVDGNHAPLPALLAMGCLHHHLIRKELRTQIGIIIESAEPREVHHFALLFGYGADCINPYLAYKVLQHLIKQGELKISFKDALKNYRKALHKGVLKILAKMGVSTIRSYRGAQIFEALGLNEKVIQKCFSGTVSRIEGVDFDILAQEAVLRHKQAFNVETVSVPYLTTGGVYQWKKDGEYHLWNPETIAALQDAVRKEDYSKYKEFAHLIDEQLENPTTLRSLFKFKKTKPISVDKVEPVEEIFKRFATGAMSFGSISKAAHETLAVAMNRLGGKSNTGEGGEDPARFVPLANGDSVRSAIKQVASGRFGVTTNYLVNADELQIKIAQGAKPGEGGQLPGHKVSAIIAKTRYTTPGVTLISPPPHHDIYSIEDLAQLIFDLKNVNPQARISVKLVSECGVGTVAAGVAKGHADMILISGGDGGTGASPRSSIMYAGLPWELGLAETHQTLVLNDLRSRLRLQTDGQMRTGRDVAIAAMLGAEEFGFCSAVLVSIGCVMLRHCHLNNCSLGVATQDEILERRFQGRPEYVVNYFNFVACHLREIMAELGVRSIDEMVGRADLLEVNDDIIPWKAKGIDYSRILYSPQSAASIKTRGSIAQNHGIEKVLDRKLIELSSPALRNKKSVHLNLEINNTNRTVGAMLSGETCRRYGEEALPENTIHCKFKGVAGQSFGAWLVKGVTFELEGLANDYVGKGVFGGKIVIYPDKMFDYHSDENVIIGNTCFYGAISGEAYIRGVAGERFCIRNSGLNAVIEGVGDHGCEYMTGGRVVILGRTGRNFGAGMSGGIAYVYDQEGMFKDRCNMSMVELEELDSSDILTIQKLLENHFKYTESELAKGILDSFNDAVKIFVKVMPLEYKRILEGKAAEEKADLGVVSDG